ncbi:hypothetical protein J2I47_09035 [Fibrella sp. HMF5335]|uniref:Uncharacterized protein n=1 Tax=Fibrella rubiginis TaxID=2817060 RepID=A0A939K4Y2_9BACT|nr:hypothetical protein [Fibrella rubiginis]MBO0936686.1 hypothetical protein [Fibrella rubiginis]
MASLLHFAPNELLFSPDQTKQVLLMFWPTSNGIGSMTITDPDRGFAQALLIEAIAASNRMNFVEGLFRTFYRPNVGVVSTILALIATALRRNWLSGIDPNRVKIYESVRASLARNWRSELEIRLQTDSYIGY